MDTTTRLWLCANRLSFGKGLLPGDSMNTHGVTGLAILKTVVKSSSGVLKQSNPSTVWTVACRQNQV
jgi:hypothetical protein